jgi:hypothetical protein
MVEKTGDAAKSQGCTQLIVDANTSGKRDDFTEAGKPLEANKDMRSGPTSYARMVDPVDGSVGTPSGIVGINPRSNPPQTALTELYGPPMTACAAAISTARAGLGGGHLASFDPGKCKVLNGPTATRRLVVPPNSRPGLRGDRIKVPYPKASMPRAWADASAIPLRLGKAGASGYRAAIAHRGCTKAAKA